MLDFSNKELTSIKNFISTRKLYPEIINEPKSIKEQEKNLTEKKKRFTKDTKFHMILENLKRYKFMRMLLRME